MKINERGVWEGKENLPHGVDEGLAKGLAKFFMGNKPRNVKYTSVYDFGCGNGYYTKYLNDSGIYCEGFDGNPCTPEITGGLGKVLDLSQPFELPIFDWSLSLEVAEHIPQEYESIFISNLHRHNTEGVIISWSIPEYGGDGHVNPRPNSYVIALFEHLGYTYDYASTEYLRSCPAKYPEPCYWFSKTIFVFRKD